MSRLRKSDPAKVEVERSWRREQERQAKEIRNAMQKQRAFYRQTRNQE